MVRYLLQKQNENSCEDENILAVCSHLPHLCMAKRPSLHSNLPIVVINTNGANINEPKISAQMKIFSMDREK